MSINQIVMEYIKKHKRKIYGGFAQNQLVKRANPKDAFYKENERPDIDFYSPTCGPCQMLTKLIDEKLEAYGEENGIKVVKCNFHSFFTPYFWLPT